LIVAVVLIAGLAAHMPTHSWATHWIEDQRQLVEQQRMFER
jgi:hypothetical protein